MPKPFQEAFEEWKNDNRYAVGEDIGWEYADDGEAPCASTAESILIQDASILDLPKRSPED